jgi:phosphoglycolate phosphatase-like HAD superfamily hydrolase
MGHPLSIDGVPVHGSTDTGILRDAFLRAGIPAEVWQPREKEILARMCAEVQQHRALMSVTVMPGVLPVLQHLKNGGKRLGVASGNLEQIGWTKIEVAGLREWFTFGGFSDCYPVRADMIANALVAGKCEGLTTCVIGDTPSDISAARANGLPVIAVATGHYSFEELLTHQPEVCTPTLEALLKTAI